MNHRSRREFLSDVGRGMLVASVGSAVAGDMGLSPLRADTTKTDRLTFGELEPLVLLMQDTPAPKLLPLLVERMKNGTDLKTLVAAGALANARSFAGEDYVGYHTLMALAPAYDMSRELPTELAPLPVLKVLYRNTAQIQARGCHEHEALHPVEPVALPDGTDVPARLVRTASQERSPRSREGVCSAGAQFVAQGGLRGSAISRPRDHVRLCQRRASGRSFVARLDDARLCRSAACQHAVAAIVAVLSERRGSWQQEHAQAAAEVVRPVQAGGQSLGQPRSRRRLGRQFQRFDPRQFERKGGRHDRRRVGRWHFARGDRRSAVAGGQRPLAARQRAAEG